MNVLASVMDRTSETTSIKLANDGLYTTSDKYFVITVDGVITDYTGESLEVIVPETINGIVVKEIGTRAFSDKDLTSIKLPNTIVKIGPYALSDNNIKSIVLPSNLEELGIYSLMGTGLNSLELPSSLTIIGEAALAHNYLTTLNIPNTVTYIGDRAIVGNKIKSITIPNSVTHLGLGIMRDNLTLEDFNLPMSLKDDVLTDQRLIGRTFDENRIYLTFYSDSIVNYY